MLKYYWPDHVKVLIFSRIVLIFDKKRKKKVCSPPLHTFFKSHNFQHFDKCSHTHTSIRQFYLKNKWQHLGLLVEPHDHYHEDLQYNIELLHKKLKRVLRAHLNKKFNIGYGTMTTERNLLFGLEITWSCGTKRVQQ